MTPWRRPRRLPGLDLTPLIDVVFTLLLMVVLSARFGPSALGVDLPRVPGPGRSVETSLEVVVTEDAVLVDGRSVDDVASAVVARRRVDQPVLVAADAGVAYERVLVVIKSLADAGVEGVSLAYDHEP